MRWIQYISINLIRLLTIDYEICWRNCDAERRNVKTYALRRIYSNIFRWCSSRFKPICNCVLFSAEYYLELEKTILFIHYQQYIHLTETNLFVYRLCQKLWRRSFFPNLTGCVQTEWQCPQWQLMSWVGGTLRRPHRCTRVLLRIVVKPIPLGFNVLLRDNTYRCHSTLASYYHEISKQKHSATRTESIHTFYLFNVKRS